MAGPIFVPQFLKMKKIVIPVLFSLLSPNCYSQGFYLKVGLGYAGAIGSQSMYDTPIPFNGFPTGYNGTRNNTASTEEYSIKGVSMGAGTLGTLGVGYMFTENIGVQLDAGLSFSSKKYTFNDLNVGLSTGSGGSIPGNIMTTQQANSPFLLMPSLVLQSGDEVKLYTRVGLVLPMSASISQHQVVSNAPGTGALVFDDYDWTLKTSFSAGFSAAVGVKYAINDRMSVWGEVSFISLSVYAKEQDLNGITETSQGVSQAYPASAYGYSPTIKFSKNAVVDSSLANMPTYSIPFSNIGVNIGFAYQLSDGGGRRSHKRSHEDISPEKPYRRR